MPNVIEFESRRNDDDWRQDVENALSLGYGIFRFQKVDGSIRELMCSLKPELFPEPKGDSKNQSKPGLFINGVKLNPSRWAGLSNPAKSQSVG